MFLIETGLVDMRYESQLVPYTRLHSKCPELGLLAETNEAHVKERLHYSAARAGGRRLSSHHLLRWRREDWRVPCQAGL